MRTFTTALALCVLAASGLSGCGPGKEGMKNRQAAADRMNLVAAQVNYEQSRQLFASGQLDKSLREIDKAIARYPNLADYHLQRGRILLEQARLELALQAFTTALEKNPRLADAQYYAGVVYQRWSDDEQAYRCYSEAFTLAPDKVHYLAAAAESLVALGEFQQASDLIEPKLAYFEHNAALRQLRAQIAMLQGDSRKAADLYAEARLLNPDDLSLMEEMTWAQFAAGQYAKCLESSTTLLQRLDQQWQSGARSQAVSSRSSEQGISLGGERPLRPDIKHLQAQCLAMMGRGPEAREMYLQLLRQSPADPTLWSELGTLAWELGDYRNLSQAATQLLAIAPDRYEGYLFRAVNERHKGNPGESVRLLRESCQRAGGVAMPFLLLGQSLEQQGDRDGAKVAYNQALQVDPDSPEAKALLGRLNGQQVTAGTPDSPDSD